MDMNGIIPLSWTMDTVGPLGRRVCDVGAFWAATGNNRRWQAGGLDPKHGLDPHFLDRPVAGWRVGIPRADYFSRLQPEVSAAFERTLKLLGDLECRMIDLKPGRIEEIPDLCIQIMQAEGSTFHERYKDRENLYGLGFRERIFPGRDLKATTYLKARQRQAEIQEEWLRLAAGLDAIVLPSGPALAPAHGQTAIEIGGESFPFRHTLSRFTRPFNLLGWPAISLPNGVSAEGLPTGVQIAGLPDSEERLLILGYQLEKALGLADKLGIEPKSSAAA
jgi:aspartyl-tRNA(Asn)/glutamyl-tRNA(Gln) amidotransferase subunit A